MVRKITLPNLKCATTAPAMIPAPPTVMTTTTVYSERRGGPEHRGAWGKLDVGFLVALALASALALALALGLFFLTLGGMPPPSGEKKQTQCQGQG